MRRGDGVTDTPYYLLTERGRYAFKKFCCRLILLGGDQGRGDHGQLTLPGDLAKLVEHPMFDASAQDPTAQQKCIDLEDVTPTAEDHHANQAIITKPVADLHHPAFQAGLRKPLNLALGAAHGGEVELIGPLSELSDAG